MTRTCDCSHLKARHRLRLDPQGTLFCPKCDKPVPVEWVLNSILDVLKEIKGESAKAKETETSKAPQAAEAKAKKRR